MKPHDVVATLEAIPVAHLAMGQVGTIVDRLDGDVALVEFADLGAVTYALEAIPLSKLIELRHAPAMAA